MELNCLRPFWLNAGAARLNKPLEKFMATTTRVYRREFPHVQDTTKSGSRVPYGVADLIISRAYLI